MAEETVNTQNQEEVKPVEGSESQKTAESSDAPTAAEPKAAQFSNLQNTANPAASRGIDFILDIPLQVTVEVGRANILINDLLQLGQGSVVELSKLAGEAMDIFVNQKLIARGEVVVVNEKFGIRITDIISPLERIEQLK